MKAVYVLLLLVLVEIVCAKATLDRLKEPSHSKHPEDSGKHSNEDDDKHNEHGGGHDSGHDGSNGGGQNGGNGSNGDDNGGYGGLIDFVLQLACSLLGPLLNSLGLDGLCLKFQ